MWLLPAWDRFRLVGRSMHSAADLANNRATPALSEGWQKSLRRVWRKGVAVKNRRGTGPAQGRGEGRLRVETSEAYAISLTTSGDRWRSGAERHGENGQLITDAEFDLAPFRGLLPDHRRERGGKAGLGQPHLAVRPRTASDGAG